MVLHISVAAKCQFSFDCKELKKGTLNVAFLPLPGVLFENSDAILHCGANLVAYKMEKMKRPRQGD